MYKGKCDDTGSDVTLVRSDIANYLKLDGITQNLKIANAVLNQKRLQSKLVSFEIYSDSQPDPFTITNARVVPNLSVKYRKYNPNSVKLSYTHLRDIPIPKLHPGDVTLIIRTNFPKLLLNQEYKEGKHCEPYAIKTYLGWVLMGGNKRLNTSVNFNLTQTFNVEGFWEIENYGTIPKQDDRIMTKDEKRAHNKIAIIGKKVIKNEDLKTNFHKTVKQCIDHNHATKIPPVDLLKKVII